MRPIVRLLLILSLLIAFPLSVQAANDAKKGTETIADKPTRITERNTPIMVELEGTDSLGSRLATRLKEVFNASNLFTLSDKDVPKIRLLITTVPEFPSRPNVGSAYAVVWVFSQSDATLRHYLTREVGVLTPDEIDALAAQLVSKTDGLASQYGYLFQ